MPNTTFLLGNKLIDSSKFLKTQQISLKKRPLEGGEKECHFLSCRTVAALSLLTSNRHMNKISIYNWSLKSEKEQIKILNTLL